MAATKSGRSQESKNSNTGFSLDELNPVDRLIPFNRRFLNISSGLTGNSGGSVSSILGRLGNNVKGMFLGSRSKEMERQDIIRWRRMVGNLKDAKLPSTDSLPSTDDLSTEAPPEAKTKKERLEEKRKSISQKAKEGKKDKDKNQIGLRIEMEKLKKKYPSDGNLVIMDAILTSRDGCLPHRSINDRVSTLMQVLKETGRLVANKSMTTYSVDTLFDIYFLYLESLKKLFLERMRKLKEAGTSQNSTQMKSLIRDSKLLNILLGQIKLKKTINNVAQKLNGFGYPFISMSTLSVSKTFNAEPGADNEKIGPGTVKLNRFLVKIYLNVFSQIPIFQPIASRLCDALPNDHESKIVIANVNIDNAYTQLKISKVIGSPTIPKQTLALFLYGRQIIRSNIKDNASNPAEARVLLRTAEMAEENAFLNDKVDPETIKFGYRCASLALSFFKPEAERIIRRLFEVAELRKIDLRESSSEDS